MFSDIGSVEADNQKGLAKIAMKMSKYYIRPKMTQGSRPRPFTGTIFFVVLGSTLALSVLYILSPQSWAYTFTSILAYLVFDLVSGRIVKGFGKGRIKIPGNNLFQSKRNGFFAFLFGEIIGISIAISLLIQYVADLVNADSIFVPLASFLACIGSAVDFWLKYYHK